MNLSHTITTLVKTVPILYRYPALTHQMYYLDDFLRQNGEAK